MPGLSYTDTEVAGLLLVMAELVTAYAASDPEVEPTKVEIKKLINILNEAGIDDAENVLDNEFEEILPEAYVLNNDANFMWLS